MLLEREGNPKDWERRSRSPQLDCSDPTQPSPRVFLQTLFIICRSFSSVFDKLFMSSILNFWMISLIPLIPDKNFLFHIKRKSDFGRPRKKCRRRSDRDDVFKCAGGSKEYPGNDDDSKRGRGEPFFVSPPADQLPSKSNTREKNWKRSADEFFFFNFKMVEQADSIFYPVISLWGSI